MPKKKATAPLYSAKRLSAPCNVQGGAVRAADGRAVALFESTELAQFFVNAVNQRPDLIRCLNLFRGELESRECPPESPAYRDLLSVLSKI